MIRKILLSNVYVVAVVCKDCSSIKRMDNVYIYRYEADNRADALRLKESATDRIEVKLCPVS